MVQKMSVNLTLPYLTYRPGAQGTPASKYLVTMTEENAKKYQNCTM